MLAQMVENKDTCYCIEFFLGFIGDSIVGAPCTLAFLRRRNFTPHPHATDQAVCFNAHSNTLLH